MDKIRKPVGKLVALKQCLMNMLLGGFPNAVAIEESPKSHEYQRVIELTEKSGQQYRITIELID